MIEGRTSFGIARASAAAAAALVTLVALSAPAGPPSSPVAPVAPIDWTLLPTSSVDQERVRPPRRPPNRIDPRRPGSAPRRLPPNRVQPDRERPSTPRPDGAPSTPARTADAADAGLSRLETRLGPARPTGRGITVAMVEADEGGGKYAPDRAREEFRDITFVGGEGGGISGHATATARRFFGGSSTAATGISQVHLFSADEFLRQKALRMGDRALPASLAGIRIIANAWVGDAGGASNEARQRIDVLAARDGVLIVAGLPNSGPLKPLLAGGWNVLQVGTNDSGHSGSGDRAGDGTGGERPRITAPGGATSAAVPVVAAAAAMLMETAAGLEEPAVQRLAGRPEVITAVMLAGARRENTYRGRWSDGSELISAPAAGAAGADRRRRSPIDPAVGAGALDVDASHRIISAGPTAPGLRAPIEGWSILAPAQNEGRWVIDVVEPTTITANLVWYRTPVAGRGLTLANLDLDLLRVTDAAGGGGRDGDADGAAAPTETVVLASDALESSVEGLFVRIEEPGRYVLRVRDLVPGDRTGLAAVAWRITAGGEASEDGTAPRGPRG